MACHEPKIMINSFLHLRSRENKQKTNKLQSMKPNKSTISKEKRRKIKKDKNRH